MDKRHRIAVFVSHPIHYVIGFLRAVAKDIDLKIYFGSDFSIRENVDPTFGQMVRWYKPEILSGLDYEILPNNSPYKHVGPFFSLANFSIFRKLARNKYDAIFINGWNYFSNWLAFVAAILTGTPFILRGESPMNQESGKGSFKLFFKWIILGALFRFASAILYIGEENRKFYAHYGVPDSKLFFAPYAVDNEFFFEKNISLAKAEARRTTGLPEAKTIVLFLGKLIPKKHPQDVLRAFLSLDIQNATLVFAGDGPLRAAMEKEASGRSVIFSGFVKQESVADYYAAADIFVLPSGAGETWGLVVNEAMCFGLPVIASDVVGCGPDLVRKGENGEIFVLGDIKDLAGKLKLLVEDQNIRERYGKKSIEIVRNYSYTKDAEALREALNRIRKK